jgi:catechol 2,3-dioxygenase-like lactoylglutathione lyase family enzyme
MSDAKPDLISSVDHTGITVSSLTDALAFWVGVLGFRHLYTWDFEGEFIEKLVGVKGTILKIAMVEGPGQCIELLEYAAPADRRIYRPRSCDVGSVHVAFYVNDIAALVDRVTKAGWTPLNPIQTIDSGDRAGFKLLYLRDSDGVTLEFMQRP